MGSRSAIIHDKVITSARCPLFVDRTRPVRLIQMGICAASAAGLLLSGPSPFEAVGGEVVCWITAVVLFLLVLSGRYIAQGQGDNAWLAPPYLLMALFFFRYGWGALVAYYWGFIHWEAHPEMRGSFLAGAVWANLAPACRLVLLGAFGMAIGVSLRRPRLSAILPRLRWGIDFAKLQRCVFFVGPSLAGVFWLITHFALPKSISYPVQVVASLSNGMLLLGTYYLMRERGSGRMRWFVYLPCMYFLSSWTALPSGQMVPFLLPLLMIACGYVLARRSLPWAAITVAAPVLLFVVLPFISYYKFAGINTPTEVTTVDQRLWVATEAYSTSTVRAKLEVALSRSVARFSGLPFPAKFLQYFPGVYPFENGRTFLIELSGLVPRFMWPGKPEVSVELNHYSERVGLLPRGSTTSMVFDGVSEYYVNFGGIGVFLMAIVNGWYLTALYTWLVPEGNYVIGSAVFLPLLLDNWDFFGVVNIAATHARVLPVWILGFYLMSHRTRAAQ